jgi:hypothetical protein
VRACLDLIEENGVKLPTVDILNIDEHIVTVGAQVEEDRTSDKRRHIPAIADEDGFMFLRHEQYSEV